MGDCNLRIRVSDALREKLATVALGTEKSVPFEEHWRLRLSSDATMADVLEMRLNKQQSKDEAKSMTIGALLQNKTAKLWDCTYHPAKDITKSALVEFPAKSGPQSLTLYDAGWFPSGTLILSAPDEGSPARLVNYDDVQYNAPSSDFPSMPDAAASARGVELKHLDGPALPSQVLHSVTTRFEGVQDKAETDTTAARQLRHAKAQQVRQRNAQRNAKLQARITQLDQKANSNGVANQVQKMLIKSRATGRANLLEQDRVYLRVIVDDDIDDDNEKDDAALKEDFCFVSRQDVVGVYIGKVFLSQRSKRKPHHVAELLVRQQPPNDSTYSRIPNLMRFYEAIEQGFLKNFDRVVIRIYDPAKDEPTPGVSIEALFTPESVAVSAPSTSESRVEEALMEVSKQEDDKNTSNTGDCVFNKALAAALVEMDKPKKGKTKSSSAASVKVRQMQMKSKAKGDSKRVKMPDRFFLEIVVACRDSTTGKITVQAPATPYFLAKSDPLQRLVKDEWVKVAPAVAVDMQYLTPIAEPGKFRRIPDPSTGVQQLSTNGLLDCFDRMILLLLI